MGSHLRRSWLHRARYRLSPKLSYFLLSQTCRRFAARGKWISQISDRQSFSQQGSKLGIGGHPRVGAGARVESAKICKPLMRRGTGPAQWAPNRARNTALISRKPRKTMPADLPYRRPGQPDARRRAILFGLRCRRPCHPVSRRDGRHLYGDDANLAAHCAALCQPDPDRDACQGATEEIGARGFGLLSWANDRNGAVSSSPRRECARAETRSIAPVPMRPITDKLGPARGEP